MLTSLIKNESTNHAAPTASAYFVSPTANVLKLPSPTPRVAPRAITDNASKGMNVFNVSFIFFPADWIQNFCLPATELVLFVLFCLSCLLSIVRSVCRYAI